MTGMRGTLCGEINGENDLECSQLESQAVGLGTVEMTVGFNRSRTVFATLANSESNPVSEFD